GPRTRDDSVGEQNRERWKRRNDVWDQLAARGRKGADDHQRCDHTIAPRRIWRHPAPSQKRYQQRPWKQSRDDNGNVEIGRFAVTERRVEDPSDMLAHKVEIE